MMSHWWYVLEECILRGLRFGVQVTRAMLVWSWV